jgi:hypothetical protein
MSISSVKKAALAIATSAALAFTLSGCAATATPEAAPNELPTITAGKLTIGTGLPAYEPWVVGDAPENLALLQKMLYGFAQLSMRQLLQELRTSTSTCNSTQSPLSAKRQWTSHLLTTQQRRL